MPSIRLICAKGPTGRLLREQLQQAGVEITDGHSDGIISYGCYVANPGIPTLNARAGALDKYRELGKLAQAQVPVPKHFLPFTWELNPFPLLGRDFHHARGKGIRLYRAAPIKHHDFYTQYIPKHSEYRVWAYRRRTLGLYQKVKKYAPHRKRLPLVWNWENGYAFEFVPPENRLALGQRICDLGWQSVDALGLDFGATDIIVDMQGNPFVLEVNTAPGVEELRQGFTGLVSKMVKWIQLGMPKRKGEEEVGAE